MNCLVFLTGKSIDIRVEREKKAVKEEEAIEDKVEFEDVEDEEGEDIEL